MSIDYIERSDFLHCYLLGVTYKNTPIHIREKIFFSEYNKIKAIEYLSDKGLDGVVILSTCNRCEIYISTDDIKRDKKIVRDFFTSYFNMDKYIFEKTDKEAIEYIFEVSSGLDSMIPGEDQILGQVKDALSNSIQLGASSKYLNKLFREAITVAKFIKTKYKVSQNPISISYIAVKMMCEKMDIKDKKIMILGTGKIGLLAINHLVENGARNIICLNRNYDKIQKIIQRYPFIKHGDYEQRYKMLNEIDILITSTASPHLIIKKENMPNIYNDLYMLDLSLPRDIDENIKKLSNVKLYNIDDISKISKSNIEKRRKINDISRGIIYKKVEEFELWSNNIQVDNTIKHLNERCIEIQTDTMEYINRKIELNHREKKIIEKMLSSALKRIIKPSINTLKNADDEDKKEYINRISEIFELGKD